MPALQGSLFKSFERTNTHQHLLLTFFCKAKRQHSNSVTDLANVASLWQFFDSLFLIWQNVVVCIIIGLIFIVINGQILQNNLKNGPFPASFSLFSSFQYTVDRKQMFNINIKFCPCHSLK